MSTTRDLTGNAPGGSVMSDMSDTTQAGGDYDAPAADKGSSSSALKAGGAANKRWSYTFGSQADDAAAKRRSFTFGSSSDDKSVKRRSYNSGFDAFVPEGNVAARRASIRSERRRSRLSGVDFQPPVDYTQGADDLPAEEAGEKPESGKKALGAQFDDSGKEKWVVLLGAWCALFASFGWRAASGIFQDYYQTHQLKDDSPSTIAWINSVGFFLIYAGALAANPAIQRWGPRPVLAVATCMHVGGIIGTSFSSKFYQFLLAQGVLSSLGACCLFFCSITTMSQWFAKNRGLSVGVGASGTAVGGVIFPLAIQKLLPEVGFGWTMRVIALIILCTAVVAVICIHEPPADHPAMQKAAPAKDWKAKFAPLKNRTFMMAVMGISFFSNTYFLVLVFAATVSRIRGWDNQTDSIVILNAAAFIGRIAPGVAADYLGAFNMMISVCTMSVIIVFAVWIPAANVPGSIAFSAVFGFFAGSSISLGPTIMFQMSDRKTLPHNMMWYYAIQSIWCLVITPIGGALLTAGGHNNTNPLYLQIFGGLIGVVGIGTLFLARQFITEGKLWVRV